MGYGWLDGWLAGCTLQNVYLARFCSFTYYLHFSLFFFQFDSIQFIRAGGGGPAFTDDDDTYIHTYIHTYILNEAQNNKSYSSKAHTCLTVMV